MKIVILAQKNSTTVYIVNQLALQHECYLIEEKSFYLKIFLRKAKRYFRKFGFVSGLKETFMLLLESPYLTMQARKYNRYLTEKLSQDNFENVKKKYTLKDINDQGVVKIISKHSPEVVIVLGTSIISKLTIEGIKKYCRYLVNVHLGITPEYRGVKPEFWSILNNEINLVGTSIHHLDAGVDTGKIIMQETLNLENEDKQRIHDYRYLRYKNALLAYKILVRFLAAVKNQILPEVEKNSTFGKLYTMPRWKDYRKYYKQYKHKSGRV